MVKPEEKFFSGVQGREFQGKGTEYAKSQRNHYPNSQYFSHFSEHPLHAFALTHPTSAHEEPASPLAFERSLTGFSPLAHVRRIGNFFLCIAVPRPLAPFLPKTLPPPSRTTPLLFPFVAVYRHTGRGPQRPLRMLVPGLVPLSPKPSLSYFLRISTYAWMNLLVSRSLSSLLSDLVLYGASATHSHGHA